MDFISFKKGLTNPGISPRSGEKNEIVYLLDSRFDYNVQI